MSSSPEAEKASRWLLAAMKQAGVEDGDFAEVARRAAKIGKPVDRTSIMRIAKAEAKTAPKLQNLVAIGEALGVPYPHGGGAVGELVEEPSGRYALKVAPGADLEQARRAAERFLRSIDRDHLARVKSKKDADRRR